MIFNHLKTLLILSTLGVLLVFTGKLIGGNNGAFIALMFALVFNVIAYFFSDKIALSMYKAQPLDESQHPEIFEMVSELAHNANLPMPKLWLINHQMANAFATGRNPKNASIAVTTGILDILDHDELRGVLAHELSHVKNRDILVSTIAATLVAAVAYLADMARWALWFGRRGDSRDNPLGIIGVVVAIIVAPMAAMLLQLSISRTREYMADESGAKISHSPLSLASALEKIHNAAQARPMKKEGYAQQAMSSLFICSPFAEKKKSGFFSDLFSTHPAMDKRVEKLRDMV